MKRSISIVGINFVEPSIWQKKNSPKPLSKADAIRTTVKKQRIGGHPLKETIAEWAKSAAFRKRFSVFN